MDNKITNAYELLFIVDLAGGVEAAEAIVAESVEAAEAAMAQSMDAAMGGM